METELKEAEKREQEIEDERETLKRDCMLSAEKAAQLKVSRIKLFTVMSIILIIF